jgi:ribonuclease HI
MQNTNNKIVEIWTDGACSGNPGPGGLGAILKYGDKFKEISLGYSLTTNNRMELMAVIAALEALKRPSQVLLHSDSKYVVEAMEKGWPQSWQAKGWRKKDGPAKNPDLWEKILELCEKHEVKFSWVKGHAGHEQNERCDELARMAIERVGERMEDNGYKN